MNRRRDVLLAAVGGLFAPMRIRAQPVVRVWRIGILLSTSRTHPGASRLVAPFLAGMRERGYVEGRNLVFEWREADGRLERHPALAAELVALKPDVIVAGAPDAALAAKKATDTIPIVFVASADPVGAGLVASFARPGGNATGVGSFAEPLNGKRLQLLQEIAPGMRHIAVIHGPSPVNKREIAAARDAIAALAFEDPMV
ncbi:MAG: ABC transporter substrate-binding protein [Pseudomonadota bacterium]